MPRSCTVCAHPEREAIDLALVEGVTLRDIPRRFGLSKDAAARHKAGHLPATLLASVGAIEIAHGDKLIVKLRALEQEARAIGKRAHDAGDLKTALAAVRELTRLCELTAKVVGDISDAPVVNVTVSSDWLAIRQTILSALAAYPDARLAVVDALTNGSAHG